MLEIETLSDQQAYSIHGRVRFGIGKEIERKGDTFFKYGGLVCRLHEHNYADIITEKSETFYIDRPDKFRSMEIVLRDKAGIATDEQKPSMYAKGTRQFFTVEVMPEWCSAADSVRRIATPEGLRGLEVCADGQWLLLVLNPTDAAIVFDGVLPWAKGELSLHAGGSREPKPQPLTLADGRIKRDVPAHQHIVVVKGQR